MKKACASFIWGFLFLALPALAAESIGSIKRILGEVKVFNAEGKLTADSKGREAAPLTEGMALHLGDTLETGPASKVMILFDEAGNSVVLGPKTLFRIEKSGTAADTAHNRKQSIFQLERGEALVRVKKKYNREKGELFDIKTPIAVAGVRGTVFYVKHSDAKNQSWVMTLEGQVNLMALNGRSELVMPDFISDYQKGKEAPSIPRKVDASDQELLDAVKPLKEVVATNAAEEGALSANNEGQRAFANESLPLGVPRQAPPRQKNYKPASAPLNSAPSWGAENLPAASPPSVGP